jgi:hypothetical protein
MKKISLTLAIVLGLGLTSLADPTDGGMFQRGYVTTERDASTIYGIREVRTPGQPKLPAHDQEGNQEAPLGSGIALLLGLGGAYLVGKKRREE